MNASFSIPLEKSEVNGSIENRHITAKSENHYCCTWETDGFYISPYSEMRSPIFTVSNRSDCKWYLSLQSIGGQVGDVPIINCYLRLVLDRESECEEASVKFKLTILSNQNMHECNLDSSRTFKFVRKSENSAGISSAVESRSLMGYRRYGFRIVCEMKIETAFSEVDSFSSDFGSLLINQLLTDVVLSVGEKKFPAHKVILTARSSVFAAMFAHNMVENQGEVQIKDMAEDIVEEMLRFIYTGEVENLNELAADLLMAGDKYDLKGLRIKCEKVLISNLSSSNVLDVMALAKLHNATELKIKAMEVFLTTCSEIMDTPAWKNLGEGDSALLKELCEAFMKSKVFV